MRVAFDTNRYVDFCRGVEVAVQVARQAERIYLPFVVIGELRAGFLGGTRSAENERVLSQFLARPRVAVLHSDDGTTHHYARLFNDLRRHGTPIPTNDLWIAALVVQHDLALFARDKHYDRLPQLPRV